MKKAKNELVNVFSNKEFGEIRTVMVNGKIMFVGNDIAKALGYSDCPKAIRTHCKGVAETSIPSNGGKQMAKVITKGDIYRLIVKSQLPQAEKFESWIFDEVLVSIDENGGYISSSATNEQVKSLVECHTFKSITKQIKECDILKLEEMVDSIIGINVHSKKANRDKYHDDLSASEYKVKTLEHVKKAVDSRPITCDANGFIETAVRYKISDKINKEAMSTTRRSTSHIVSHKDKQIKELANTYEDKLKWLDYAPFSLNYMYTKQYKITDSYKKWMDEFPYEQLENRVVFNERVDSDKAMRLIIEVVSKEGQDIDNLCKSLQDRLQDYYRFNDVNIKEVSIKSVGTVQYYNNCKIGYYLENIKQNTPKKR